MCKTNSGCPKAHSLCSTWLKLNIFQLLKLYSQHVLRRKQLFESLSWSLVSAKTTRERTILRALLSAFPLFFNFKQKKRLNFLSFVSTPFPFSSSQFHRFFSKEEPAIKAFLRLGILFSVYLQKDI
jgi:hypothetical protein